MEAEFVNVFVQKQKDTMNDLLSRAVMLDTRATIAEAKLKDTTETSIQLQEEMGRMHQALGQNRETIRELETRIQQHEHLQTELRARIDAQLPSKIELEQSQERVRILEEERDRLQKLYKDLEVKNSVLQMKVISSASMKQEFLTASQPVPEVKTSPAKPQTKRRQAKS
jgi:chromosome segregation ATPase